MVFKGEEERKMVEVKVDKDRREKFPLYFDGETVAGKVTLTLTFVLSGSYLIGTEWF